MVLEIEKIFFFFLIYQFKCVEKVDLKKVNKEKTCLTSELRDKLNWLKSLDFFFIFVRDGKFNHEIFHEPRTITTLKLCQKSFCPLFQSISYHFFKSRVASPFYSLSFKYPLFFVIENMTSQCIHENKITLYVILLLNQF